MILLGDSARRPASFPVVTVAIIVENALVSVLELVKGDAFP